MDRASLRAMLLLRGFKRNSRSKYNYRHEHSTDNLQEYKYVHVAIYPYWFIGVSSVHGVKNFVSVKKAWCYINKALEDYDQ